MSSILVKAYLHPDTQKQEIRRIHVDELTTKKYCDFVPKVTAAFPELKEAENVKLFWKDQENDLICLSTDSELSEAMSHQSSEDTVRVFLKTADTPAPEQCISPEEWWKNLHTYIGEYQPFARGRFGRHKGGGMRHGGRCQCQQDQDD